MQLKEWHEDLYFSKMCCWSSKSSNIINIILLQQHMLKTSSHSWFLARKQKQDMSRGHIAILLFNI